ncbi:MAG: VanZ family protein [Verrucomicrobia bacterium]|nr:VanZ family protein [Verrucomicrobiota bacterium]
MKHQPKISTFREWLWPIVVAITIFMASGRSQVSAPQLPGIDKIAHFFVYGLLGTLIARVPSVAGWRGLGLAWAVVIASLFGITDEFHQSFTPGRSVELADWAMDTSGAALAVFVYTYWQAYRRFMEYPLAARSQIEVPAQSAPDFTP